MTRISTILIDKRPERITPRLRAILVSLAVLFLAGCGENRAEDSTQTGSADPPESHAGISEDGGLGISLDNGSKWTMDDHTRAKFSDMRGRLDSSLSGKELGARLQEDLDQLIARCTMTGEAHDQLHVYLMEFIPAVAGLGETGDPAAESRVRGLLDAYPRYFE